MSHWMYHGMHGMGDYFLKHGLVFSSNTTKKKMICYPASSHHLLPLPLGQVWDLLSPSLICEAVSPIVYGLCRWPQLLWAYEFNDCVMSRICLFYSTPSYPLAFMFFLLHLWWCSLCLGGGDPHVPFRAKMHTTILYSWTLTSYELSVLTSAYSYKMKAKNITVL